MNVFNRSLVVLGALLVTAINADYSFANKGGRAAEVRAKVEERMRARAQSGQLRTAEDIQSAFREGVLIVYPHLATIKGGSELMEALGLEYRRTLEAEKSPEATTKLNELNARTVEARQFEANREALRSGAETAQKNSREDLDRAFEHVDAIISVVERLNPKELAKTMKPLMLLEDLNTLVVSPEGVVNLKALETLKDVLEKAEARINELELKAINGGEVGELTSINTKEIVKQILRDKFPKVPETLLEEIIKKCFA